MVVYDSHRNPVTLGGELAHGGEAVVYRVQGQAGLLAKIYTEPRAGYESKLAWMVTHPPSDPNQSQGHGSIAWPHDLLLDSGGKFIGYLMSYIQNTVPLLEVFNPRLRSQTLPGFNWTYLHRTARNLAATLGAIHDRGYVVGDLNESNILVMPTALVLLIDTDSFQVQEQRQAQIVFYPCPVGKPEYTPPELQGKAFQGTVRHPEHDCFGLAVLIFQLLMEGSHPFRSRWLGAGDPPSVEEKISKGWFPYTTPPSGPVAPPPNAPSLNTLHPRIVGLIQRCFVDGHQNPRQRPTPKEWEDALGEAEHALIQCPNEHFYADHLRRCPRCGARRLVRQTPKLPAVFLFLPRWLSHRLPRFKSKRLGLFVWLTISLFLVFIIVALKDGKPLSSYEKLIIYIDSLPDAPKPEAINIKPEGKSFDDYMRSLDAPKPETLSIKPEDAIVHYNLGETLGRKGDWVGAIREYRQAIKIKPDYAEAHYGLGITLVIKYNDLDGAIREYRQAIKIKPDYADAYYSLGLELMGKGDLDGAIRELRQAISIKPDYSDAYDMLGDALKEKGDLDGAIREYRQAVKIKPDYAEAYGSLGRALHSKGDVEGAIREYRKVISIQPDDPDIHDTLGSALADKGDFNDAINEHRQAIKIKPDVPIFHNNFGFSLIAKGDFDNAIREFRQAISIKKSKTDFPFAEAHYGLSLALKGKGDLTNAIEELRTTIRQGPAKHWNQMQPPLDSLDYDQIIAYFTASPVTVGPPLRGSQSVSDRFKAFLGQSEFDSLMAKIDQLPTSDASRQR